MSILKPSSTPSGLSPFENLRSRALSALLVLSPLACGDPDDSGEGTEGSFDTDTDSSVNGRCFADIQVHLNPGDVPGTPEQNGGFCMQREGLNSILVCQPYKIEDDVWTYRLDCSGVGEEDVAKFSGTNFTDEDGSITDPNLWVAHSKEAIGLEGSHKGFVNLAGINFNWWCEAVDDFGCGPQKIELHRAPALEEIK